MKTSYVYILTNKRNGTLYVGVTKNLSARIWQHKQKKVPGFTKKYGLTRLVYCEGCQNIAMAIGREKQIKNWKRVWKLELIESINPKWEDLYEDLYL